MESQTQDESGMSRRHLLQWMGGLSALLTAPGCVRQPRESIIPYARMPENIIPGRPLYYATAMPSEGYGIGLLVETHLGRPIKIEGNPLHPASLGATDSGSQASVLSLYDPQRARAVFNRTAAGTWIQFTRALRNLLENPALLADGHIRVVMPPETSPTVLEMVRQLRQRYPGIVWHRFAALPLDMERRVAATAFGRAVEPVLDFSKADTVVFIDCDFGSLGPGRLRHARELTQSRGEGRRQDMNRIYSLHSTPTLMSAYADHRLPLSLQGLRSALVLLARTLGLSVTGPEALTTEERRWIGALAEELKGRRGRSLIVLDGLHAEDLHQLVLRLNATLGNMGETILWQESLVDALPWRNEETLVTALATNKVQALLLYGVNPVYSSPFAGVYQERLPRLAFSAQLSPYFDETARLCQWHIPQNHFLESWGDICAYNGLVSIIQPTIAPLFAGQSLLACLQAMIPGATEQDHELVKAFWQKQRGGPRFDRDWEDWLNQGFIPGTGSPAVAWNDARLSGHAMIIKGETRAPPTNSIHADLVLRPDPSLGDGCQANNPWLQELPKPFSKLTWENALYLHPDLARTLQVQRGDLVELETGSMRMQVPVLPLEQHPRETVSLGLGYGRDMPDHLCSGLGVNAYRLRRRLDQWTLERIVLRKVPDQSRRLPYTQSHFMDHPHQTLAPLADWQAFLKNPGMLKKEEVKTLAMEPTIPVASHRVLNKPEDPLQWGMSIDTSTCIGCNACVVACQAENNIPVVGKEGVLNSREMHWLRIDHYFSSHEPDAECTFQPVPCMHCETAPCEIVCPVAATVHSDQGLNQMVYNRCVGTRYCSNNCPYKVRHFNFYDYVPVNTLSNLQHNPDVSVRSRGVMEKCTYCIQRIQATRIDAEREGRSVDADEVQTACAQACPTRAIVFGNIKEEKSRVSLWKKSPRNYELLGELNTRPRTSYLAHLKNFNALLRNAGGRSPKETEES